ncbi:MAG: DEAD/DEAH box helicase [Deltaproteobacteria bacterium]|nr:DEAD/DEAH box helicase [Myxococcales bacterium]MDP3217707.1 DEAD/DEAH box helicase [Deltaproteobacteria bacterium]
MNDDVLRRIRATIERGGELSGVALREYQRDAALRVLDEVDAGHRRILLVAPTGSGKTIMFSALAAAFHAEGLRVLVVAHRRELITQAEEKLHASGIDDVGVYGGGQIRNRAATVQVASIQMLRPGLIAADLVVIDEAHHAPAKTYLRLLRMYPHAVHVGPTATPWWGAGKALGDYFQAAVVATSSAELTAQGYLAPVRMFTHPHTLRDLDLRGVGWSGDDYQIAALTTRVDKPALLGDIVEHWRSHSGNTRTLCFAASVEHSRHIVARFKAAGVVAEHLDGTTAKGERAAILARLRSGATRVVCSYNVLTEGFDEPSVGCIILARPTRRSAVYLQAVGRGRRLAPGKADVVVLDHAGACLMHGLPDIDRAVSLDVIERNGFGGAIPVRRCPACGMMVPLSSYACPECSNELRGMVPTEEPSGVLVEVVLGPQARQFEFAGRSMTAPEWAGELGLTTNAFYERVRRGKKDDVFRPLSMGHRLLTANGRTLKVKAWAKLLSLNIETIKSRMMEGQSPEDCLRPAETKEERDKRIARLSVSRATEKAQRITIDGETMTFSQWGARKGLPYSTIKARFDRGESPQECVRPIEPRSPGLTLEIDGETLTARQWSKRTGAPLSRIYKRLARGLSPAECVASNTRENR